jgi:hypothetical protein
MSCVVAGIIGILQSFGMTKSISFGCQVVAKAYMSSVVAGIIYILQSFRMTKSVSFGCQVVAKAYMSSVVAGIIDILQSFGMTKRLEHSLKSLFHDGDTVSVHRPSFYAARFKKFMVSTCIDNFFLSLSNRSSYSNTLVRIFLHLALYNIDKI